ncbi:Uncharacterised protein [uncultured archaeon]|nr:Uncharacterised protein [uncultured archaeon]
MNKQKEPIEGGLGNPLGAGNALKNQGLYKGDYSDLLVVIRPRCNYESALIFYHAGEKFKARGQHDSAKAEYEKAISELNKSIESEPENSMAYLLRAGVHFALGQGKEAFADAKTAAGMNHNLENSIIYREIIEAEEKRE